MKKNKRVLNTTKGVKKFYSVHPFSSDIFIYNNKVLMINWLSAPPLAVLVSNEGLAESYRKIFNSIWNNINALKKS